MASQNAITLHNILFRFIVRVHPVTIRASISVVAIIVGELAAAKATRAYVVVMQRDIGANLEAVELLIGWPPPITFIGYYLLSLKAKAIHQMADTVWHDLTLVC